MAEQKYTPQQRARFYVLVDQGASVRAACARVGVPPHTGYRWVKQAGLSVARATPRAYTVAEKEEIFRRLQVTPNVSAVARSLGFTRVTCYKWAHQAWIERTYHRRRAQDRLGGLTPIEYENKIDTTQALAA